jgi:hypothetical protein
MVDDIQGNVSYSESSCFKSFSLVRYSART